MRKNSISKRSLRIYFRIYIEGMQRLEKMYVLGPLNATLMYRKLIAFSVSLFLLLFRYYIFQNQNCTFYNKHYFFMHCIVYKISNIK
jgi:hypothetical protein